ncbi:biotin transporter BioY [Oceanobacillus alkalisoli]|uniref:biotin transporter BioY n=1 Tax=Oceanobacillus alkalisoli TaxID=2925113 RepID=UPI001F11ADF6|nr:biotin transporter BioY [Oceanobacillus alkalisoli]MCF3943464.1 biotin transporter BioY [Oceanobacillus alkalisoli]
MSRIKPIDLTFGAMFVCLMTIGANITVWFPFLAIPIGGTSVPVSLQTFFATLAGFMLGKRLGAFAIITYILVGTSGVPIFAGLQGGPFALISPTGGFIISFVFIAYAAGWISEKFHKESMVGYSLGAFAGLILNYVIGVSYMYLAMNTWLNLEISYLIAWTGMIPFLIKDTALSFVAAFFMVQLVKRVPANWIKARA